MIRDNPPLDLPALPLLAYSHLRSFHYRLQQIALYSLSALNPLRSTSPRRYSATEIKELQSRLSALLARDVRNIRSGLYPSAVLKPESAIRHLARVPVLLADALRIELRRSQGRTTQFGSRARERLEELPRYYRRNFHFQTDGYLSRSSARLYDHQVEVLFGGAADPMRRLILEPLRAHFGRSDGRGLRFLELGAGAGSATRFVSLAFPRAKIVSIDLSEPYLKQAQSRLGGRDGIAFLQAPAEDLTFRDASFDAVFSVFLFHELPLETRRQVVQESLRVLKPGGLMAAVDSLQLGDHEPFDVFLREFAKNYHEPYYRNYLQHPIEKLFSANASSSFSPGHFPRAHSDHAFFSKICWVEKSRQKKEPARASRS